MNLPKRSCTSYKVLFRDVFHLKAMSSFFPINSAFLFQHLWCIHMGRKRKAQGCTDNNSTRNICIEGMQNSWIACHLFDSSSFGNPFSEYRSPIYPHRKHRRRILKPIRLRMFCLFKGDILSIYLPLGGMTRQSGLD